MPTAERTLTIVNAKGLHVRAATVLAQTAARFGATVTVARGGDKANGKSVMNLLLLTAAKGTEVHVTTAGDDAEEALAAVSKVIEDGFYEG
jgi:phosphocarrier protein